MMMSRCCWSQSSSSSSSLARSSLLAARRMLAVAAARQHHAAAAAGAVFLLENTGVLSCASGRRRRAVPSPSASTAATRLLSSARPLPDEEEEETGYSGYYAASYDSSTTAPRRWKGVVDTAPPSLPPSPSKPPKRPAATAGGTDAVVTPPRSGAIAEREEEEAAALLGAGALPDAGESAAQRQVEGEGGMPDASSPSEDAAEADESDFVSPSELLFAGGTSIPVTSRLRIVPPGEDAPRGTWPCYRIMDENGEFRDPSSDADTTGNGDIYGPGAADTPPLELNSELQRDSSDDSEDDDPEGLAALRSKLLEKCHPIHAEEIESSLLLRPSKFNFADTRSRNLLARAYVQMVRLREMDDILQGAQRQGRISFYMTCRGEEAIHVGSGSALLEGDPIFAQYREQGLLMWRGFTLEQFANQCFANDLDLGKGRQMPVHYGSRALNYHTVSSPLGTQLPQAVGAAYKLKLQGNGGKPKNVVACFFGDGCASTTDFHPALNFAATLRAPVLFVCRNNGYAISTPVADQYAGDGVVSRAPGYGMAALRVDGNDVFAVHAAIRKARRYAIDNCAPVLVECMTYRQGHHSTSDDSTRYRGHAEIRRFAETHDPISRLGKFLDRNTDWLSNKPPSDDDHRRHRSSSYGREAAISQRERLDVLAAMEKAERRPKPLLSELFEDVYAEMPPHLRQQRDELRRHVERYPKRYGVHDDLGGGSGRGKRNK